MKQILKPIFEIITGGYILFDNIIYNYIAMSIIGTIAYFVAKKLVGCLYKEYIIKGKTIGSVIHWTVRLIVFSTIFSIFIGLLWVTKFFMIHKNVIVILMSTIVVSIIILEKAMKYKLLKKINWRKLFKIFLWIVKILGTIIVFLLMPIILNWIIEILINYRIIEQSYDERVLNFYATIIGGFLTLLGVWITIKYENKTKKEDDVIKYKPILEVCGINEFKTCILREVKLGMPFSFKNDDPKKEEKHEKFYRDLQDNTTYRILIQNKGRGETFGAVLNRFEFKETNWDKDNTLLYSAVSENQYIGEILKDAYLGIDVKLPNYMFMPEKQEGLLWYELRTNIIIRYSDMFNKKRYQYEIYIKFKVSVERFEEEQPYFYKNGFRYAKVNYDSIEIMPSKKIYSNKRKKYVNMDEYIKEENK